MQKYSRLLVAIFIVLATLGIIASCHSGSSNPTTPPDSTGKKDTTTKPAADTVAYSFAVFGCNRIDKSNYDPVGNPSTANLAQLDRNFTDILNLSPRPDYLFVVGDLVLGKTTDTSVLGPELRAWRQHYESSPIATSGIKLVVLPGNHETNDGTQAALCEKKWIEAMAPYIAGSNGPKAGGADNLSTDQSQLSYSFDYRGTHFVLLNSDPANAGGTVPTAWAAQDMAAAHTAGAKHIFVLDHKPAYDWTNDGSSSLTSSSQSVLWNAMTANHAEAMLSAHNHVYRRLQPTGHSWMIIPGNGGSSLDSDIPSDRNYGFSVVEVMKSETVIVKTYARNFGANYNDPSPAATYPTALVDSADISWK